ncbi:MAG: transglycosylase SLT domain-containing protein [Candidatus Rokuibacteriota bacterium]
MKDIDQELSAVILSGALSSSMAIRGCFPALAVSFCLFLAPGAAQYGAAEPRWSALNSLETCPEDFPDSMAHVDGRDPHRLAIEPIEQNWPTTRLEEWNTSLEVFVAPPLPKMFPFTGWNPESTAAITGIASGAEHYPIVTNSQVGYFLERFTRERRDVINQWLNRSGKFLGMIRETLNRHGLPEELAFTAMIESGFNPIATSHAGARGLWQFMAATARRYGLRVDHWVDERLDPEKSTIAAAAYLRDLYNLFGSWFLAQAAYNAGEGTVARAIRATGSSDFWTLARTSFLQRETKEFVPQILAATHIGREPIRYGFEPLQHSPPVQERVAVPGSTDLRWVSASAGIAIETLRSLNPVLVRGITPPGGEYQLNVPPGTKSGVLAALERPQRRSGTSRSTSSTIRASTSDHQIHVVRPRDTVDGIARRYGVSVGDVLRWNSLAQQSHIRPGDRLRVGGTPGGR